MATAATSMVDAIAKASNAWHVISRRDIQAQHACLRALASSMANCGFPEIEAEFVELVAFATAECAEEPATPMLRSICAKRRRA